MAFVMARLRPRAGDGLAAGGQGGGRGGADGGWGGGVVEESGGRKKEGGGGQEVGGGGGGGREHEGYPKTIGTACVPLVLFFSRFVFLFATALGPLKMALTAV